MKKVINELFNESLERRTVENKIPESLLKIFLNFFDAEDHDEMKVFLQDKLEKSNPIIPLKLYMMIEFLCEDFGNLIWDIENIYYDSDEDDNDHLNTNIYLN